MVSPRLLALVTGVTLLLAPAVRAQDSDAAAARKVDRSLRESLRSGGKRDVIVTVKPGYRAEIRKALRDHGDRIRGESALVNAVNAEIHAEDVDELARHPWVEAISDDAIVFAGAAGKHETQAQKAASTGGKKKK